MEHSPLPNHESEYSMAGFAPRCIELAKKIYGNASPSQRQIIQLAHLTTRRPDINNPSSQIELALVESFKTQFNCLDDQNNFLKLLRSDGFFGSVDGIKIQTINNKCSSNAADSVVVGNLEMLLKTAEDLNLNMLLGIYSGDENGFLIAPKTTNSITKKELKTNFQTKLQENVRAYYAHPYFSPMQKILDVEHKIDKPKLGLTINLFEADKKLMYLPTKYVVHPNGKLEISPDPYQPSLKNLIGYLIDTNQNTDLKNTTPMIDHLISALTRTNKEKELKHAEYEQIFPDQLKIRKIGTLAKDLENFRIENPKSTLHLVQIADVLVKDANSYSHSLGDFHMIATMNIFQRYLKNKLGLNPHDDITYYQHNGSFLLTLSEEKYELVKKILDDPIEFNNHVQAEEMFRYTRTKTQATRQDPVMRAKPYIVGTSTLRSAEGKYIPITISPDMPVKEVFNLIDLVKIEQITNETLTCLYASSLARALPLSILNQIEKILRLREIKPSNHDVAKLVDLSFMASVFNRYYAKRPNNYLTSLNQVIHQISKNFRHSFTKLPNQLSRSR